MRGQPLDVLFVWGGEQGVVRWLVGAPIEPVFVRGGEGASRRRERGRERATAPYGSAVTRLAYL